jgi:hypothetical protein
VAVVNLREEIIRVVGQNATHVATRLGGYFEKSVYVSGVWIVTVYGREGWKAIDTWTARFPMHESAALLAALQHFRVKYGRSEEALMLPPAGMTSVVWG